MNVQLLMTVLKTPPVLTLLMALSVSVHLSSWVMEERVEMAVFWTNAHQSQTVLKMPLVLTLLMALSVSVHQTSLEMVEQVELDATV